MKKINFGSLSFVSSLVSIGAMFFVTSGAIAIVGVLAGFIFCMTSLILGIKSLKLGSSGKVLGLIGLSLSTVAFLYLIFGFFVLNKIH